GRGIVPVAGGRIMWQGITGLYLFRDRRECLSKVAGIRREISSPGRRDYMGRIEKRQGPLLLTEARHIRWQRYRIDGHGGIVCSPDQIRLIDGIDRVIAVGYNDHDSPEPAAASPHRTALEHRHRAIDALKYLGGAFGGPDLPEGLAYLCRVAREVLKH